MITAEFRPRLYDYLGGTIRGLDGISLEIGGIEDHVHLLIKLKPTHRFSDFMRDFKSDTSVWAKKITDGNFEWQNGYAAFSVGESQVKSVRRYIQKQETHHAEVSFESEFKYLLKKSGHEVDERFLWT
jgi:hypothetical protein